jgi:hypothetical protein
MARLTLAVLLAGVLGAGCSMPPNRFSSLGPLAEQEWPAALAQVQLFVQERRFDEAERLLVNFAQRYPNTREDAETLFWRGLYRLDPANRSADGSIALDLFGTYLRSEMPIMHRSEAETLERVAVRMETLREAATAPASAPATATPSDRTAELRAKDAEIQRLKDELAKANDELERIKKRLAVPTKP